MSASKASLWTAREIARVESLVRQGVHTTRALHLFPGRTPNAIDAKFTQCRKALGLPPAQKGNRTPATMPEPPKLAPKPKLVFAPLAPEPKRITEHTPEAAACKLLLRRHLQTGVHWLDRERFAIACQQAGLRRGRAA